MRRVHIPDSNGGALCGKQGVECSRNPKEITCLDCVTKMEIKP